MRGNARERAVSAGMVILLHAGALWLLLHARNGPRVPAPAVALSTFQVAPFRPRPPERRVRTIRRAGSSGRSGTKALRGAVTAPIPVIVPPSPPAPSLPQSGDAVIGGAAVAGVGSGAGLGGTGAGSGGSGDGPGAGGSRTRARLISGTIGPRDYPKAERSARIGGVVTVAFTVAPDGRAYDCEVVGSSGSVALDATTCRLVEARFRYAPARNAAGAPIAERRGWQQRWWTEGANP